MAAAEEKRKDTMDTSTRNSLAITAAKARLLGVDGGSLAVGARADVTVIDPYADHQIDPSGFASMGKNTPFAGRRVRGRVTATVAAGRVVYER